MAPTALAPLPPAITYVLARRAFRHRLAALDALARYLGPTPGRCPSCRAEILIVGGEVWPDAVAVEPVPVLEQHPCNLCAQVEGMGHSRRRVCHRCKGTRFVGEPIGGIEGIAVDQHGMARRVRGERADGEALHRLHVCPERVSAAGG